MSCRLPLFLLTAWTIALGCLAYPVVPSALKDEWIQPSTGRRSSNSFEPYKPATFLFPDADADADHCCGEGTGGSGCKYFTNWGICGGKVCDSCADVPCGKCQQGCERSDCTDDEEGSTRNACSPAKEPNDNHYPRSCRIALTGEIYNPTAFQYPEADPCCGVGTGSSGCKYFTNWGICGGKTYTDGICESCADVPCGKCQHGCERSDCTAAEKALTGSNTRNSCSPKVPANFGVFPNTCAKRFVLKELGGECETEEQLMSYQECEAAAKEKITAGAPDVKYVPNSKKHKLPPGCSVRKNKNDGYVAFYNAKNKNEAEAVWQTKRKPGKAHERFQPVCLAK